MCFTSFEKAISPFPTVFFYPFGERSAIFFKVETVGSKLFQFGRVYHLSFGKGLNLAGNVKVAGLFLKLAFTMFVGQNNKPYQTFFFFNYKPHVMLALINFNEIPLLHS